MLLLISEYLKSPRFFRAPCDFVGVRLQLAPPTSSNMTDNTTHTGTPAAAAQGAMPAAAAQGATQPAAAALEEELRQLEARAKEVRKKLEEQEEERLKGVVEACGDVVAERKKLLKAAIAKWKAAKAELKKFRGTKRSRSNSQSASGSKSRKSNNRLKADDKGIYHCPFSGCEVADTNAKKVGGHMGHCPHKPRPAEEGEATADKGEASPTPASAAAASPSPAKKQRTVVKQEKDTEDPRLIWQGMVNLCNSSEETTEEVDDSFDSSSD
jgi:hypothetical protein